MVGAWSMDRSRRRGGRTAGLVVAALAIGQGVVLAGAGVAGAAPSASALCAKVSAGAVGKIVSGPVSTPSTSGRTVSSTDEYLGTAHKASGLVDACVYGATNPYAPTLSYWALSGPLSVATFASDLVQNANSTASYTKLRAKGGPYGALGASAFYLTVTDAQGAVANRWLGYLQGTKAAIADVSGDLSTPKLEQLADLARGAYL